MLLDGDESSADSQGRADESIDSEGRADKKDSE